MADGIRTPSAKPKRKEGASMNTKNRLRALLALLVLAALLMTACGTPAAPETPAATEAPAEPEVTEAPAETPEPQTAPLPEGAVEVGTVDELLAALAPNAIIVLREGEYDLSRASSYGLEDVKGNYSWDLISGGCQLNISQLKGLRLIGQGEVSILAQPRYAEVLRFTDCWDLRLEGLTLGHTQEPGVCAAGVLSLENCEDVRVENCRLFGCGSMGVTARNCEAVTVANTRIDSCSNGAVLADSCLDLRFEDCELCDCGLTQNGPGFDLIYTDRCKGFALVNCRITGNRVQQLLRSFWSDQTVMLGCQVEQNRVLNAVFQLTGRSVTVDKCSFQRRSSDSYYPSGDIVFAKNPDGEDLISFDLDRMELARAEYDGPKAPEEQGLELEQIAMPDGSVQVNVETVDELLTAIAPNTTVVLQPGTYDLSAANDYGGPGGEWYAWDQVYDGFCLRIQGVQGLRIVGVGQEEVLIQATPRYAAVFSFQDCEDLELSGFTAGHSPSPAYCTGNVLDFFSCWNVTVKNCDLFGCGVIGICATACQGLTAESVDIYECSYAGASINNSAEVCFRGCRIFDCDDGSNYIFLNDGTMTWDDLNLTAGIHLFDFGTYVGTETPAW